MTATWNEMTDLTDEHDKLKTESFHLREGEPRDESMDPQETFTM